MQRRTRTVATLGPATDRPGVLEQLIDAGLNVARINFSHGTGDEHLARIARLRSVAGDGQAHRRGDGRPARPEAAPSCSMGRSSCAWGSASRWRCAATGRPTCT